MPKFNFSFYWSKAIQQKVNPPKGYLVIKPDGLFIKPLAVVLNTIEKKQQERIKKGVDELIKIDSELTYFWKKRTVDQNALMWNLYEIIEFLMNAGMQGGVKRRELYNDDMYDMAGTLVLQCPESSLEWIKEEYRIILNISAIKNKPGYLQVEVLETSSHWDTKRMAQHIDLLFNRISEIGGLDVEKTGDILNYRQKWLKYLNDEKISIHGLISNPDEYKKLHVMCEGCFDHFLDEAFNKEKEKNLCHIKAVGQGGNSEESKETSDNWLILCNKCHIETQHKKGWKHFLELYSHLTNKVKKALKI